MAHRFGILKMVCLPCLETARQILAIFFHL